MLVLGASNVGKSELKHQISGIEYLPTTMKAAGGSLSLLLSAEPDIETAGALAGMDPALACAVLRMANAVEGGSVPETLVLWEAVDRVGLQGLQRAALDVSKASLSVQGYQRYLERHFQHALTCATCAAKTASHTGMVPAEEAYVAGLLHDIGRLALVASMPEDYCAFWDSGEGPDIDRLERTEFGADHALVGKWLAERWSFPRQLSQAIWFHHLPPGSLLGNLPVVPLVSVVGFANAMSHWILDDIPGFSSAWHKRVRVHGERLDLDYGSIQSLREQTRNAVNERLRLFEREEKKNSSTVGHGRDSISSVADTAEGEAAVPLTTELKWLQSLNRLNTTLRPRQSLEEVLGLIVATAREGLEASPGMCCAFDETNRNLTGMTWDALDCAPQSFSIPLSPSTQEELDEVEILALEALEQLGIGMGEKGWRGSERTKPELRDGILILPMVADGVTRGLILFEADARGALDHLFDEGMLIAFSSACGAVLARYHAYAELRELSEELAETIARKAADAPGTESDGMTNFAVGVAHALQRRLNVLANQAHLLLRRVHTPEETRAVEAILEQNHSLGKLMSDLMAFARPGSPGISPTVVNYILHGMVSTLSDRLRAKGITIIEDYEEGLPRVTVDRHQLEHALLNLIVNAEQAMAQTGGTLTLRTSASEDRRTIQIWVEDSGPGIPEKHAEAVFDPFVSLKDEAPGTGLGLAVCRAIVRKHGGDVRLVQPGMSGAVFEVSLPVERETAPATHVPAPAITLDQKEATAVREGAPEEEGAPTTEKTPEETSRQAREAITQRQVRETPFEEPGTPSTPSLLLIDENEITREVLKEALRNRGFTVIAAQDAVRAMQALAAAFFDVVLLDFELNDVSGASMLKEIQNIRPGIPIVAMTVDTNPVLIQAVLKQGARACLVKPFAFHELLNEVEDIVGIHNN